MVAIARALLNENRILLVDEPTKGLAPLLVAEVATALERVCEESTVLLVEQNLAVVSRVAEHVVVLDTGRVVHAGPARELLDDRDLVHSLLGVGMSTVVLLTITGLGLGAMYFLVASGLSLIYGLMGVLNFAHGGVHHRRRVRELVHRPRSSAASRSRRGSSSARSWGSRSGRCSPRSSSWC